MGFFVIIIIMKDRRNFDYWVILMIIGAAIPIILQFKVRPLTSAFFFFVLPTLYLFLRDQSQQRGFGLALCFWELA